jgi:membrane protease YdiL (CAAX protease family)
MKRIWLIFLIIAGLAIIQLCLFLYYISLVRRPALFLSPEPLISIFIAFAHLVLATLIILERNNLSDFHLDKFTIYIFVFASFFRVRTGVVGENISLIIIAIAGMAVAMSIFRYKVVAQNTNLQWSVKGIGFGLLIAGLGIFINLIVPTSQMNVMILQDSLVFTGIKSMFFVFPDVIMEEILFRGFLWGYLRRENWNSNKIAWFQGVLFWAMHSSRVIVTPVSFFILIPLVTFASTKLLLKSQQTYPSILSHAVINILGKLFYLALI